MATTTIANLELNALTAFQEELHHPSKKGEIESNFYDPYFPVAWYSKNKVMFDIISTEDLVRYTPPDDISFIISTYLRHVFPRITVRQQYRDMVEICWSPYPTYAAVKSVELKQDGIEPTSFGPYMYLIHHQLFRKHSVAVYNRRCGNVPELTEFATDLPAYKCSTRQPFFYSRSASDVIPSNLNTSASASACSHNYSFNRDIKSLLRMRVKNDDEGWSEIPVNLDYIDIEGGSTTLSIPQMWGNVSVNTSQELDKYRCDKTGITRYYEDVIHLTSDSAKPMGELLTRSLAECSMPCRYMVWMCENVDATNNRCFGNFTTDSADAHHGTNPMLNSTLAYTGKIKRFNKLENDHFADEMFEFFPSQAADEGYNAFSFCTNTQHRIDTGVVLKDVNAVLSVNLDDKYKSSSLFKLHVFLFVTRKISYSKDESGRFTCTLSE